MRPRTVPSVSFLCLEGPHSGHQCDNATRHLGDFYWAPQAKGREEVALNGSLLCGLQNMIHEPVLHVPTQEISRSVCADGWF